MANKKERRLAAKASKVVEQPVADVRTDRDAELSEEQLPTAEELGVGKDGKTPKVPKTTKSGLAVLPKLKRARKPKPPKDCECGCGLQTRGGRFLPGHDARLHGWALRIQRGLSTEGITAGEEKAARAYLAAGGGDAAE
jgi:hypothetical protein